MTDLNEVIGDLFRLPQGPSRRRRYEQLDQGIYHLDYGDDDHVYLLTVRQVPRVRLPYERPYRVGEIAGVPVQLLDVTVANHVELVLDAKQCAARQAGLADFVARFDEWSRGDQQGWPPPFPAESFILLRPEVSDDVGTPYRLASTQAGGTGTEWDAIWRFLPPPPVEARLLKLRFSPPDSPSIELDLPLPSPEP